MHGRLLTDFFFLIPTPVSLAIRKQGAAVYTELCVFLTTSSKLTLRILGPFL